MNYSFRGGFNSFNYGFKSNFRNFSQNFSKSFFKNKSSVNFLNNQANSTSFLKINFGNKYFMSKILALSQSSTLVGMITNSRIVSGATGSADYEADNELGTSSAETSEALVMVGDVCLLREDCKWTCGTRLASGPVTPVLQII